MTADSVLKILLQLQADTSEVQSKLNPALDQTKAKLGQVAAQAETASVATEELASVIGGALGAAAAVGVGALIAAIVSLPAIIESIGEEWRKLDAEINKASDDLNKQVLIWDELSGHAGKFADVVAIGAQGVAELTKLTEQLNAAQSKQLSFFEKMSDLVGKGVAFATAGGVPFGGGEAAARTAEIEKAQALLKRGLIDITTEEGRAVEEAQKWQNTLAHPTQQALDDINAKLETARQTMLSTDPSKSVANHEKWVTATKDVELYSGRADALHKSLSGAADAVTKTLDQTRLLRAEASGDQEAIIAQKVKNAYDDKLKSLVAAKVPMEQAQLLAKSEADAVGEQARAQLASKGATEGTRDAHRDILTYLREESGVLQTIREQQSLIDQNPFLSSDQKNDATAQLIPQQIAALNQQIEDGKAILAGSALDPATYEQVSQKIHAAGFEVEQLQLRLKTTSFTGAIGADLVGWVNQFGTTAHQVAGIITSTLSTAVGGLSNAITGLIFKTTSWKQAFAQAAQAIVANIIQIVLQWAVSRAVMFALNLAFGKGEAVAINAEAQAAASAWAPAAIAASIASYGAAAGAGNLAFIAALLSGTAFATGLSAGTGGFEGGGFTGGREGQFAGIVHGQEYVLSAPRVSALGGPQGVENLVGSASGGGASGPRSGAVHIFTHNSFKEAMDAALKSNAGKRIIVDTVRGHSVELGI